MSKNAQRQEHYAVTGQLLREHNRALVKFLRGRLRSEHEAREVAQEAYVRLLQLDQSGAAGFLRARLFRIAAELSADSLRERETRRHIASAGILEGLISDPGSQAGQFSEPEFAGVRLAMDELSDECRQAFVMHVVEGASINETAQRLRLHAFTVRHYVSLGLCRMVEGQQLMRRVGRHA